MLSGGVGESQQTCKNANIHQAAYGLREICQENSITVWFYWFLFCFFFEGIEFCLSGFQGEEHLYSIMFSKRLIGSRGAVTI